MTPYDWSADALNDRRRFLARVATIVCVMCALALGALAVYLVATGRFAGTLLLVLAGAIGATGVAIDEMDET